MSNNCPTLYVFSGLPGSGKSTLAKLLSAKIKAAYLRIDTIEQGLRDLCSLKIQGEGYRLSYRIAADNLLNDVSVIADSCNPIVLTRNEWNSVAGNCGAAIKNIEVICSDAAEHRRRIEDRTSEIINLIQPTWEMVINREYHQWDDKEVIKLDTAGKSSEESFAELLRLV